MLIQVCFEKARIAPVLQYPGGHASTVRELLSTVAGDGPSCSSSHGQFVLLLLDLIFGTTGGAIGLLGSSAIVSNGWSNL